MNKMILSGVIIAMLLILSACSYTDPEKETTTQPVTTANTETETTTAAVETTAQETTDTMPETETESQPTTDITDENGLMCEQELIFDGYKYDNRTITGNNAERPDAWHDAADPGLRRYENDAYPHCYIERGPAVGIIFTAAESALNNTAMPDLQLYKNLTWGANAGDITAAYGTPVHEDTKTKCGLKLTNLWYKDDNNSIIIYSVSDTYGLVEIECDGR